MILPAASIDCKARNEDILHMVKLVVVAAALPHVAIDFRYLLDVVALDC